jgi:hypothetical protein
MAICQELPMADKKKSYVEPDTNNKKNLTHSLANSVVPDQL